MENQTLATKGEIKAFVQSELSVGKSYSAIAEELNKLGALTPTRGLEWKPQTLNTWAIKNKINARAVRARKEGGRWRSKKRPVQNNGQKEFVEPKTSSRTDVCDLMTAVWSSDMANDAKQTLTRILLQE
jgi:hypothetical protein